MRERFNEEIAYEAIKQNKNLLSKQNLIIQQDGVSLSNSQVSRKQLTFRRSSAAISHRSKANSEMGFVQGVDTQSRKSLLSTNISVARSLIRKVIDAPIAPLLMLSNDDQIDAEVRAITKPEEAKAPEIDPTEGVALTPEPQV